MHFTIPEYFVFLLPLLMIVVWKFFRPVPKLVVPCLRMWLGEENVQSSSFYRYLAVVIAILFSLLLIFALSSPFTIEQRPHFLLILDNSASMAVRETGLTRWQMASDLVEKYRHRGRCSIIMIAPTAELVDSGLSLKKIMPGLFQGDPVASLKFAKNLLKSGEQPVIITDGVGVGWKKVWKEIERWLPGAIVHLIGKQKNNVGIRFDGVDYLAGQLSYKVIIENFGNKKMQGNFSWSWKQGRESSSEQPFHLLKGERIRKNIIVTDSGNQGILRCHISTEDPFLLDNSISCFVRKRNKARVLVVSDEPVPYIMAALSCYPDWIDRQKCAITSTLENQQFQNYDLIISTKKFLTKLPDGHSLIFGSRITQSPFSYRSKISPVPYSHVNAIHPLADGLRSERIIIDEAWSITDIPVDQILIYANHLPLVFSGQIQASQYVYLAFRLADSNFAQQAIFPIFIYNCVLWAMQNSALGNERFSYHHVPPREQNIAPSERTFPKNIVRTLPHKKQWHTMLMLCSFLLATIFAGITWIRHY